MKTYRETFDYLYHNRPSMKLVERINSRIEYAKTARAGRRAFIFGIFTIGTMSAFVIIIQHWSVQATNSGFFDYISLLISDSDYFFSNWKVLGLSIIESMPIFSITLTIATLLLSVYAVKKTASYIRLSHPTENILLTV